VLSGKALMWYRRQKYGLVLVYGKSGTGKSVYALRALKEIYQAHLGLDDPQAWEEIKKHIIFTPNEFIKYTGDLENNNKRVPAILMDDAGVWFNNQDYKDPVIVDCIRYFKVIRTKVSCVIMTTPSPNDLVKGLRSLDMYNIKVVDQDSKNGKMATCYLQSIRPTLRTYIRTYWKDYFPGMLPDDVFNQYNERRNTYTKIIHQKMVESRARGEAKGANYGD